MEGGYVVRGLLLHRKYEDQLDRAVAAAHLVEAPRLRFKAFQGLGWGVGYRFEKEGSLESLERRIEAFPINERVPILSGMQWASEIRRDQISQRIERGNQGPRDRELLERILRLQALASPEYDRNELQRARGELEGWLERHAGHPLQQDVERDLTDCVQRLADSDLSIARFYKKVKNPQGAIFHARRALVEARSVGNEGQADEASAMLAALDVDEEGSGW